MSSFFTRFKQSLKETFNPEYVYGSKFNYSESFGYPNLTVFAVHKKGQWHVNASYEWSYPTMKRDCAVGKRYGSFETLEETKVFMAEMDVANNRDLRKAILKELGLSGQAIFDLEEARQAVAEIPSVASVISAGSEKNFPK